MRINGDSRVYVDSRIRYGAIRYSGTNERFMIVVRLEMGELHIEAAREGFKIRDGSSVLCFSPLMKYKDYLSLNILGVQSLSLEEISLLFNRLWRSYNEGSSILCFSPLSLNLLGEILLLFNRLWRSYGSETTKL